MQHRVVFVIFIPIFFKEHLMTAHEQTHPTNGSKPSIFGRGHVSNIRILYRHHKKILSTFFVLIAFLMAFSESRSQEYSTQYSNCYIQSEYPIICEAWQNITEIIEYYPGCYIEATYALRKCTVNNDVYHQMELIGYRITDFPSCNALFLQLHNPNGTINEIISRQIKTRIYQEVANRVMKQHKSTLTQQEIDDDFTCVPCTTISNSSSNYCSKRGVPFFQVYEGTCMAMCRAKETINVSHDPYGPPAGMSAPNIIIPPNYQATIPSGLYFSEYISYVKCNPYCCIVTIDYCYDPIYNRWVRLYNSQPSNNQNQCNPTMMSSNICPIPIRLWGSLVTVEYEPLIECKQTCTTIVDQLQTMQWE